MKHKYLIILAIAALTALLYAPIVSALPILGTAQSFERAIPPRPDVPEVHEILARLARRLDMSLPFRSSAEVRAAVAPKLAAAAAGGGAP